MMDVVDVVTTGTKPEVADSVRLSPLIDLAHVHELNDRLSGGVDKAPGRNGVAVVEEPTLYEWCVDELAGEAVAVPANRDNERVAGMQSATNSGGNYVLSRELGGGLALATVWAVSDSGS
jgi:hypothetical protein